MGTRRSLLFVTGLICVWLICAAAQSATLSAIVNTDLGDYAPGDTVRIAGTGFWANETVQLQVHLQTGVPYPENEQFYQPWTVQADGQGAISATWIVPTDAVDRTLYVDARGLSSGLTATATFTDANTVLVFAIDPPDSACFGSQLEVCANLRQSCSTTNLVPLPNRVILFFINTSGCGNADQSNPDDSVTTDEFGNACGWVTMPQTPGNYIIRVKFRGEPKPSNSQPANSACDPNQRIVLSSSNDCREIKVVGNMGVGPSVTLPADSTLFQCTAQPICLAAQVTDPDCDLENVSSNLGTYSGGTSSYDQVSRLNQLGGTVTQVGGGQPGKTLYTASDFVAPVNTSSGVSVSLPNFAYATSVVDYGSFPSGLGPVQSADQLLGSPTDLTFTIVGAGGPDGGSGDGSVEFSSGNFVTLGFSSTMKACNGSNSDFVLFTNSDCNGSAQLQFRLNGIMVFQVTQSFVTGGAGSGTGGMTIDMPDGMPYNQLFVKCLSGTVKLDGVAARTAPSSTSTDVCFTPDTSGVYRVILTATDGCSHTDADTCLVTVHINRPPVANAGADFSRFQCAFSQICFPVSFSDPDNNIKTTQLVSGPGSLSGNQICYTPGAAGASTFIIRVTDSCNVIDQDTVVVTVTLNSAPVAANPSPQTVFQCTPAQLCHTFTATDVNGGALTWTKLAGSGTITSGGQWCFTPTISGVYNVSVVVADSCGAKDTTSITYNVTINSAPVAVNPTTPIGLLQCSAQQVCYTFSAADANGGTLTWTKLTGAGTLTTGGQWCFTPSTAGAYAITAVVSDSCGATDTTTLTYNISLNGAPTITLANDTSIFVCGSTQICKPYTITDPNGTAKLTEVLVSGYGTIDTLNNTVCFTAGTAGTYQFITQVTDSCGASDRDTMNITVAVGTAADITCPSPASYFICSPTSICRPVSVTPAGATVTVSPIGTYSAGSVCFTADTSGTYVLRVIATSSCNSDTCFVTTTVTKNSAPVAVNPSSPVNVLQCSPTQICYNFSASDVNGGALTWTKLSGSGTVTTGGQWCFTPAGTGAYSVSAAVADSCGAKDTVNLTYNVTINGAPTIVFAADTSVHLCTPTQICRSFTVTDPNGTSGLTKTLISGYGTLDAVNNRVCFTPNTAGTYQFIVQVADSCGLTARDTVNVTVTFGVFANIQCPTGPINITECTGGQICQALTITPANATVTTTLGTYSGGQLCFNAPTSGTYNARVIASAECGADTCDITFNVVVSVPPALACPGPQNIFICQAGQVCIPVGGAAVATYTVTPIGSYSGGNVCFNADTSGTYVLKVKAVTPCGNDSCFVTAHVVVNSAPVAVNPSTPVNVFQCTATQICQTFTASDVNGGTLTWSRISGSGTVAANGQWCFTPTGTGTFSVIAQVADSCGATDTVTMTYNVTVNSAPSIVLANDTSVFLCAPTQICRSFTKSDVNNNIQSVTLVSGAGALSGNAVCFTPSTSGTYQFIVQVADSCGATARDTVNVTATFGTFADVTCPSPASYFICAPTMICRPVTVTPPSATVTVSPIGTYSAGQVCFAADTSGTYVLRVIASSSCSADTCFVTTTITKNSAPVAVNPPTPVSVFQCNPTQICQTFTASDVNGGTLTWSRISGAGSVAANGQWCFTPMSSGSYSVVAQVADSCGAADTVNLTYNVTINSAPTIALHADTTIFQCAPAQICLPYTTADVNNNLQAVTLFSGVGTVNAGQLCFTPTVSGVYTFVAQAADSCGATGKDTINVTVNINQKPVVNAGADQAVFQCAIAPICWPVSVSDPDGNLSTVQLLGSPGTYSGGQICFTPTGTLNYEFVLKATDACGAISYDTVVVYYTLNSAPVANAGSDSTLFQCTPAPICWTAGATDVNNNITAINLIAGPGAFNGSQICFTPSVSGDYTFILQVVDACGSSDLDTSVIHVTLNAPPICQVPNDTTIYQCVPTQVSLPTHAVDNNLLSCQITSGPGTLIGNNWVYTPSASQVVTVSIRCTDSCGAICDESFTVDFRINSKPTIEFATYSPFFICGVQQICLQYTATDNDSPSPTITLVGGGTLELANSRVCFNADTAGTYRFILTITDQCGAFAKDTIEAHVTINHAPVAVLPADFSVFQAAPTQICVPAACTDADNNQIICDFSGPGTFNGSQICFTPTGTGAYVFVLHVEDQCGLEDDDTLTVNVTINSKPVVSLPPSLNVFQCSPSQYCFSYTVSDPDGLTGIKETMVSGYGIIDTAANTVCFTPNAAGAYQFVLSVTDSSNASAQDTVVINVALGQAVIIDCPPASIPVYLCAPGQVCQTIGITCDTAHVTTTLGTYSNGQLCFNAPTSGTYSGTIIASTSCGTDTCNVTFNVTIGSIPVLSCPGVVSKYLCSAGPVCIPIGGMGDATVTVMPVGSYSSGNVCFNADTTGHYVLTVIATSFCGADTCTVEANVHINQTPVAVNLRAPVDTFVCATGGQVCRQLMANDPDGNPLTWSRLSGAGTVSAAGLWCFTINAAGSYTVTAVVSDSCGAADTLVGTYNVTVNSAPIVTLGNDTTVFQCATSQICVPFTINDVNSNVSVKFVKFDGTVVDTNATSPYCFTPSGAGVHRIIVSATDACGANDADTLNINVLQNHAPTTFAGADQSLRLCTPTPICWPVTFTDPDNNIDSTKLITSPGTLSGGQICFTPNATGVYTFITRVVDKCGLAKQDTAVINVHLNAPPVCQMPPAETTLVFQCQPTQISLPVSATDPDGNFAHCELLSGQGSLIGGNWVFTPTVDQLVKVKVQCSDSCGAACIDSFFVKINLNSAPVANAGRDTTIFSCGTANICISAGCTDEDGNLASCELVSPWGTYDSNTGKICLTAPNGDGSDKVYEFILKATDACGAVDYDTSYAYINFNAPPVIEPLPDFTVYLDMVGEVCFDLAITDPDANCPVTSVTVSPIGTYQNGQVCFYAAAKGQYCFVVTATDQCGQTDVDSICVQVVVDECVHVQIEKVHDAIQGQHTQVDIFMNGSGKAIGGFNFLIAYDPTVLTAYSASPGPLFEQCGWEYFTYRFGADGNCGSGCPSGLIRIAAIAETNNGAYHPGCYFDGLVGSMASIDFLVSNDRSLECQFAPVNFFWEACGDNSLSDKTGDTLWISRRVYDLELHNIANNSVPLPTYFGAPNSCLVPGGKGLPQRCVDFTNGGVDVVCADSIDARGDINLNGLPYEVADAVMFTQYFIKGLTAFPQAGQGVQGAIAASDVNADGVPLTVGDLVYLIRVVVGDASPYEKLNPNAGYEATVAVSGTSVRISETNTKIGAVALVIDGEVTPSLGAAAKDMEMQYSYDGSVTRVLVFSSKGKFTIGAGEVLTLRGHGSVKSVDLGSSEGLVVRAKMSTLPTDYSLSQNYPNPFNPLTKIDFALPEAGKWKIEIYNILGQTVNSFEGEDQPGYYEVVWDAGRYASGIYFYRLTAGSFSATRKMVLIK